MLPESGNETEKNSRVQPLIQLKLTISCNCICKHVILKTKHVPKVTRQERENTKLTAITSVFKPVLHRKASFMVITSHAKNFTTNGGIMLYPSLQIIEERFFKGIFR